MVKVCSKLYRRSKHEPPFMEATVYVGTSADIKSVYRSILRAVQKGNTLRTTMYTDETPAFKWNAEDGEPNMAGLEILRGLEDGCYTVFPLNGNDALLSIKDMCEPNHGRRRW